MDSSDGDSNRDDNHQVKVGDAENKDEEQSVTLAILDELDNTRSLLRQSFPSKAGGVPAWLDPVNLPVGRSCVCDICGDPLSFVLQAYNLLNSQAYTPIHAKQSTFHRTIFVFMCTSMSCLFMDQQEQWKRQPERPLRSVKIFRSQLPPNNDFYSRNNPKGTDEPSCPGVALCDWCGTWKGDKVCSGCKNTHYCSQKHQVVHWESGHSAGCQQLNLSSQLLNSNSSCGGTTSVEISEVLWPEFGMKIEDESECDGYYKIYDGAHYTLKSYRDGPIDYIDSELDEYEGDSDKECWASFYERVITRDPRQVLRYPTFRNTGAKPLWPLSSGRPSEADIPPCCHCGGRMIFEFQIMPQFLRYFPSVRNAEYPLEWATIVVYTCEASCDASVSYKEEFPWVQLFNSLPPLEGLL